MSTIAGESRFMPTAWSVVLRARDAADPEGRAALDRLCAAYWKPIYIYLRRKGLDGADAQDATQGFFAHVLEKGAIARAEPGRGRFRGYLLAHLEHWMANERRVARAEKRGGGAAPLSFDFASAEMETRFEPAGGETPEAGFRRAWGLAVLESAFAALRREMDARAFEAIQAHLSAAAGRASYAQVAAKLSLSVGDVTNLLHRARKRLQDLIRTALRETVDSDADVEGELHDLFVSL